MDNITKAVTVIGQLFEKTRHVNINDLQACLDSQLGPNAGTIDNGAYPLICDVNLFGAPENSLFGCSIIPKDIAI